MDYRLEGTADMCDASHACSGTAQYEWQGSATALSFLLRCSSLGSCRSSPGTTAASVSITRVAIDLEDTSLPVFTSPPAGDLFATGALKGTVTTTFGANDQGGGVYQAALEIDGTEQPRQTVDDNQGACRAPFVKAVPCKAETTGRLDLDTTLLTDGPHTVNVAVYDATGVNRVVHGPFQIAVDNVPEPPIAASDVPAPNGVNASAAASLGGIGRFRRPAIRQSYGGKRTVRGRLVNDRKQGIGNATLTVLAAPDVPGGRDQAIGTATTNAKGYFSFVTPSGPSRRISVRYRAFSNDQKDAAVWNLRVLVPAPVGLLASRRKLENGQRLLLTAHLANAKVPARSADIAFQVLIGSQWRTFATKAVGHDGIARVGHRFRVTYRHMTYRFRAVVLRRRNFPFAAAHSPATAVQVN